MNDKQNKKLIILIILSVLAVFSLIRGAVTPTKSRRLVEKPIGPAEEGLSVKRYVKRSNYSGWGRNPFTKEAPIKLATGPTLEGIMWDEKLPLALINGETVKIGDKLGSDTVIDIQKDKVILNDGSRDLELKLQ